MKEQSSEKHLRRKILEELREIKNKNLPPVEENWDLIWVLSGPETTFTEEPTVNPNVNENAQRIITAIRISKEVAALRVPKKISDVNLDDIERFGPEIFFNGSMEQNDDLNNLIKDKYFDKNYGFPGQNIIVSPNSQIEHTKHQFDDFPQTFVNNNRRIIIVTDVYHIPRSKRYPGIDQIAIPKDKLVFYPSQPFQIPLRRAISESIKIPNYIAKGDLPDEQ
ncbi:MAG TPA: hypothetical protein VIK81_03930 [Patescibacteria group bacterium]